MTTIMHLLLPLATLCATGSVLAFSLLLFIAWEAR